MGRHTIPELLASCKAFGAHFLAEWGLLAIILVGCLGSFGLGRLSALIEAKPAISMAQAASEKAPDTLVEGGLIVASWGGSTYYFPWCQGALKIAPQNQRWFQSEAAAQAAGYAPAKNCKGLADPTQ